MVFSYTYTNDCYEILNIMEKSAKSFYNQKINNQARLKELSEKFQNYGIFIKVCENKNIVGFAALYCNDSKSGIAFLSMIIVNSEYRKRGVGKNLLNMVLLKCIECKMNFIELEVDKSNYEAISFYKKNNFLCVAQSSNSYIYIKNLLC